MEIGERQWLCGEEDTGLDSATFPEGITPRGVRAIG